MQEVEVRDILTGEIRRSIDSMRRVASPENIFGDVTMGEVVGTGSAATTTISFPNGLLGVTITACGTVTPTAGNQQTFYVAFNNTAFNDPTLAGLRYMLTAGMEKAFVFSNTPRPTEMYIRTSAPAGFTAHWAGAQA